jgi:hypothetical protein
LVLNEAMGLFLVRRRRLHAVRVVVSASLLWPLIAATRDPIFAIVAVLLVGVALAARTLYLPRADHGQP